MKCCACHRAGYNLPQVGGKYYCGTCSPGDSSIRTISQTTEDSGGYYGRMGKGTITGLPKLVSLQEWQEIVSLCRKVSSPKILTEDKPFKSLPLPNIRNPLEERPSDKRSGWTPLDEYFRNEFPRPKNLFEG